MQNVTSPFVLWTNADERTRMRLGFALLFVGTLVVGGTVGYAVGRRRRSK